MRPIQVVVCIPTGGGIGLGSIQAHIEGCSCRQRHPLYSVICFEHEMPRDEGYTTDSVIGRALACAQTALHYSNRTIIGIGFERGQTVFESDKRPTIMPVAAAVLLLRSRPTQPKVVLITADDGSEHAHDLLELCKKQGFDDALSGQGPVIARAVRQVLNA